MPGNTGETSVCLSARLRSSSRRLITWLGVTGVDQGAPDFQDPSFKQKAFNSGSPLNVEPTNQGGVAIDRLGDLPEGHANMADKMIGKMQKVNYRHVCAACCAFGSNSLPRLFLGHRQGYEQTRIA